MVLAQASIEPQRTTSPPTATTPSSTGANLPLHHGVYFRPLGETIVTGSDWTACTTVNLSKFETVHTELQTQMKTAEGQLTQTKETLQAFSQLSTTNAVQQSNTKGQLRAVKVVQTSWSKLTKVVQQNLQQYQDTLADIKNAMSITVTPRTERGLIDVIGQAGKSLFGFSTEQDIADVNAKIDQLSANTDNLTHIADQQFSYIKDVASQVLEDGALIENLDLDIAEISRLISEVKSSTGKLDQNALLIEMGLGIVTSLTMINDEIAQSQKALNSLQNILAEAERGSLSWELFTGEVFRDLLGDLQDKLPSGWKLLYDADDHYSYLQYAQVNTYRATNGIHICVDLPIIEASSRYQLYEAIPLPVVHPDFPQHIYFMYQFESPYLALQHQGSELLTLNTWTQNDHEYFSMGDRSFQICQGKDPKVCPLQQAVRIAKMNQPDFTDQSPELITEVTCLHGLLLDKKITATCPAQVRYHEGPLFKSVGKGIWLYGAATGDLIVRCANLARQTSGPRRYRLVGTGAFRLQPGCQATFGNIRLPSYVHGHGQFVASLPPEPVTEVFALDFNTSLWKQLTQNLTTPDDAESFLSHLRQETDIRRHTMNLKRFNQTIQHYQALRNQLPAYHPFRWISHPKAQVSGFTILLVLILSIGVVLAVRIWRVRRRVQQRSLHRVGAQSVEQESIPPVHRRLIRMRRVRRPRVAVESV